MSEEKRNILNTINSPDDLKKVPEDDLIQLCKELREKIIDECSEHPGHFGAGLGVVELTVKSPVRQKHGLILPMIMVMACKKV